MISSQKFYESLKKNNIDFFTGVPDSAFKDWMTFLTDEQGGRLTNIIACNECEATALAAGYYLATGKIGVAYMQNSGEGKTVDPLTSLCDKEVYNIPVILMIGWRGESGKHDEPQHKKMGRITLSLLETLGVPYKILPNTIEEAEKVISEIKKKAEERKIPVAIIIKPKTFSEYKSSKKEEKKYEMTREEAIGIIADNLNEQDAVISTTGKTSRELFEYRIRKGEEPRDFYTVGSMGCSSSIANAIALSKQDKKIFIFDGDGAILMQLGSLATIGHYKAKNLYHVIFDNQSHDSTGGQPTVSNTVNFEQIALACGYKSANTVETRNNLEKILKNLKSKEGPLMLIVKINKGSRKDLGRPTTTPIENKNSFMKFLKK